MNCALKAIEGVRLALHHDLEGLVVVVAAGFTGGHALLQLRCAALAGARRLFRRAGPLGGRPLRGCRSAKPATFARGRVVFFRAPAGAALLAAVGFLDARVLPA